MFDERREGSDKNPNPPNFSRLAEFRWQAENPPNSLRLAGKAAEKARRDTADFFTASRVNKPPD